MWYRKELSLEGIAREVTLLSEKNKGVLSIYVTSLKRISEMPAEFERRCRASWIEVLLEKTRQSYQDILARCKMVGFVGDMLTSTVAMMMRQPVVMSGRDSASSLLCLGIWPSSEVKPVLRDDSLKQSGIVMVTFEEFEQVAVRLKNDVLNGKLRPEREDEIPQLIYGDFAKGKSV
jgi:hypothetical protein